MNMKPLASLFICASILRAEASSYLGPEVGQAAPTIKMAKWLQAPASIHEAWPAGKVVVLEFWSTWCGPCVAAFPHLNELSEKFKDQPVQFIAVTDEKESVVRAFLKKASVKAWIGLSADPIFGEKIGYGIYAIPHTVVIDAQGRIDAVTSPQELNAALIEQCLAGQPVLPSADAKLDRTTLSSLADTGTCPEPGIVPGQSQIGRSPMFQMMIRPTATNKTHPTSLASGQAPPPEITRYSKSEFGMTLPASRVENAILFVFDVSRSRLVLETKLPKDPYDFYILLPPRDIPQRLSHPGQLLESFFTQAIQATFGLTVKRETRPVKVLVLKANAASAEKLARSTNDGRNELYGWNSIVGLNRSLGSFAGGLENAAGQPVIDETGLTNLYSFDVQWDQQDARHPNPKGMAAAVEKLGLQLTPDKRPMELVIVRSALQ
jgi:uncharacterized protein (TIGR03435 family)